MNPEPQSSVPTPLLYPDCDGLPRCDNTLHGDWIILIYTNLKSLFYRDTRVFVAENLLWYPVEGNPEIRESPDVLVVLGRPAGHRGSYKSWEEGDVPLTVVFEIMSQNSTPGIMAGKLAFYEQHGVKEYYVYDPSSNALQVYLRSRQELQLQPHSEAFVSPHLGVTFDFRSGPTMVIRRPNGEPFRTFAEEYRLLLAAEQRLADILKQRDRALPPAS